MLIYDIYDYTVDGTNPAPVDKWFPLLMGWPTIQGFPDFTRFYGTKRRVDPRWPQVFSWQVGVDKQQLLKHMDSAASLASSASEQAQVGHMKDMEGRMMVARRTSMVKSIIIGLWLIIYDVI